MTKPADSKQSIPSPEDRVRAEMVLDALSLVEELKGQVAALEQERDKYQEWMGCGGCPNPHSCSDPSEPGHEIFGCAYGQGDGTFLCEVHNLRKVAAARETAEAELVLLRKRKDYHAEALRAILAEPEINWIMGGKIRDIAERALTPEPATKAEEKK